jgi:hypothetical protein
VTKVNAKPTTRQIATPHNFVFAPVFANDIL